MSSSSINSSPSKTTAVIDSPAGHASFCATSVSSTSVDAPTEGTLVTLSGLEGCKIKAPKSVLMSSNELLADTIEEQKEKPAVYLGDYTMRSLVGLVEFCQHYELSASVQTKSAAIALSDLHQLAQDYLFHALTQYVYEHASEMLEEVPSLGCVFLKRQKPGSSLYRLGLKAISTAPKKALLDGADDDLLKKLNRDRLGEIVAAVNWKEQHHDPELLPHSLIHWICAHNGGDKQVDMARRFCKTLPLSTLQERILEACVNVGIAEVPSDDSVALVGSKGCRIYTNRSILSSANPSLKDLLETHPNDPAVKVGDYSMRSILGLVEFCQHKEIQLTLAGEGKKKTAALALAELSQLAEDFMFAELSDHVYKTVCSMVDEEPWLAFVILKRTKSGSPLYKLGTKTFRLHPKEVLNKADDELLKKLNRVLLKLIVNQVDWSSHYSNKEQHDLLPHVLSNWICAWDGSPGKIDVARDLMKRAKIDVDRLPALVLDAGRMTGLIDYLTHDELGPSEDIITLVGHSSCRVRVVKSVLASRNAQLKDLLYSSSTSDLARGPGTVYIGDYSKRSIMALAEYCHNDHFVQMLGAKDETSAFGLAELSELASNFMFEDLVKDVYQASVRLIEAVPTLALIFYRSCPPNSALNKLALKTFRTQLKESLLLAPAPYQKLLDEKRLSQLVKQMNWGKADGTTNSVGGDPQMLMMILMKWVQVWNFDTAKVQHARKIASAEINLDKVANETLVIFQTTGLIDPAKIQAVIETRARKQLQEQQQTDGINNRPPHPVTPIQRKQSISNLTTSSATTVPTSSSSSGTANERRSLVGTSVGDDGDGSVVSVLEAECAWVVK